MNIQDAIDQLEQWAREEEAQAQRYVRSDRLFPIYRHAAEAYTKCAGLLRHVTPTGGDHG